MMEENYPPEVLEAFLHKPHHLYDVLQEHGAMTFEPGAGHLFPACRPTPALRESSDMHMYWFRDNAHIANALYRNGMEELAIPAGKAMLEVLCNNRDLLDEMASGRADPKDRASRLPVRVRGETLENDTEDRVQNDSVGYALWLPSLMIKDGTLAPTPDNLETLAQVVRYLDRIEYWHDADEGHWEEDLRIHASSIGTVIAGLRAAGQAFRQHGYKPRDLNINALIGKGQDALNAILDQGLTDLPVGSFSEERLLIPSHIRPDPEQQRELESFSVNHRRYDAALLFLVKPLDVLKGARANRVIEQVDKYLRREHGIIRYPGDTYWEPRFTDIMSEDERTTAAEGRTEWRNLTAAGVALSETEAQWTMFDPIMAWIYANRLQARESLFDRVQQVTYLQRSLSSLVLQDDGSLQMPEAYYYDSVPHDGPDGKSYANAWIPNEHPLHWAQANLLHAVKSFESFSQAR